MKEITISLWELTREEAARLRNGKEYLIYNSLCNTYRVERSEPGCLARNKRAASYIKLSSLAEMIFK